MATCDNRTGRRAFLTAAASSGLVLGAGEAANAQAAQANQDRRGFPGLISRQQNPDNLEFPFANLNTLVTPSEQFFVRNHFDPPEMDVKTWRLQVDGAVAKPFDIGYDELRKMPSRTETALLECSGNGRIFLRPPQVGIRWEQGAVGNAEWTGVPLSAILDRAGLRNDAVDVVLEGADRGEYRTPLPATPGVISYARGLPVAKARRPEVLLAFQMNGKELTNAHGFPVRAIVPGWYGMASVKWLKRIHVTAKPFHGYFETFSYTIWQRPGGLPDLVPVTEIQVKAQIARPMLGEVVPAASRYRIFGAAWTGEGEVTRVEISTDAGKRWMNATLDGKANRHAWCFWHYEWTTPKQPGTYTLMARATDSQKNVQPMERDNDRRDAMINHVQRIRVEVA